MKLLSIEFAKVKNYSTFWVILIIYAVLVPLSFFGISQIEFPFLPSDTNLYGFPTVWGYVTWTASWFNILLGVLIVILTCNEIAYKTQRQSVIDGLSRQQYIMGKFMFLLVLAFIISLYTLIVGAAFGFGFSDPANFLQGIEAVPLYMVQTIGYFALAFFFALLLKKPALSIILFIIIIMLDDFIFMSGGTFNYGQYIPTITISDLTPFPFFRELMDMAAAQNPDVELPYVMPDWARTILASVYIVGFMVTNYVILKKRDL
ncbi:MAG: ABC transporter permease [Crocinitomicaceae bacterium]